jgi:hypothetical protein
MIGDRSGDHGRDQEAKRSAQTIAMLPSRKLDLDTLADGWRRQQGGRRLSLPAGTFDVHGRNPGYGRQQGGARELSNFFRRTMPGFEPGQHALVFYPLNAGFQPLKIVGVGIQGIRRISQWGTHARMLLLPPLGSPLDRRFPIFPAKS